MLHFALCVDCSPLSAPPPLNPHSIEKKKLSFMEKKNTKNKVATKWAHKTLINNVRAWINDTCILLKGNYVSSILISNMPVVSMFYCTTRYDMISL